MSYYYYIVNLGHGGVLTVWLGNPRPGELLSVEPMIEPRVNYQLWHMDDPAGAHIRMVGSDLVLLKEMHGPYGSVLGRTGEP